tara:strand:- start:5154 stop:6275 length:1122 start_codon:yes stop_codon:yes gene_type:complete
MKLLIVSHTAHHIDVNGQIVGWGSTVSEINHLSKIFTEIYHIAPLHKTIAPKSAIKYASNNIHFVAIKPTGGKTLLQKLEVLYNAPSTIALVFKLLKKVTIFQFRAPTGIGVYLIPILTLFVKKKGWFKYAGNWKQENIPLGNAIQRWFLMHQKRKVTINGLWKHEGNNMLAFENPCLNEQDRILGSLVVKDKQLPTKKSYCFVGGLNKNKGVDKIMEAFKRLNHESVDSLHVVGDGILKEQLEKVASQIKIPIHFYGFLSKDKIQEIYKKCHFILLPSKSEGFPKVIGEAMNFGCIPIVSEVSCINQYIKHNFNGFLINPITIDTIKQMIEASLSMSNKDFTIQIAINYKITEKFTYNYYLARIKKEIVDIV